MGLSLTARIALTIIVVFVNAMGLTALLNLHKFDQLLTQVLRDRLAFTVEDLRSNLETRLNLGLPLETMRHVQDTLEQRRLDDPNILSIEVFDPEGQVLFGTDRSFIGDLISPRWLATFRAQAEAEAGSGDGIGVGKVGAGAGAGGERTFLVHDPDALVVGTRIASNLGDSAGGIAIRYARAAIDQTVAVTRRELMVQALVVTTAVGVVIVVGVFAVMADIRRRLTRIGHQADVLVAAMDAAEDSAFVQGYAATGPLSLERGERRRPDGDRRADGAAASPTATAPAALAVHDRRDAPTHDRRRNFGAIQFDARYDAVDANGSEASVLEQDFRRFGRTARDAFGEIMRGRREIRLLDELD